MMMKRKRQTKIEFTSFEKTVVRLRRNAAANVFCRECRENSLHFSIAQAALVLSLSEAAVFRAAEFGQIHSTETATGALLVCAESVADLKKEKNSLGGKQQWDF